MANAKINSGAISHVSGKLVISCLNDVSMWNTIFGGVVYIRIFTGQSCHYALITSTLIGKSLDIDHFPEKII